MTTPRKRFVGCVATKLDADDYSSCLDEYDSPEFDNIKLVPPSLKQRVYENSTDSRVKAIMAPSVIGKTLSDLPSGIRSYMVSHPAQFKTYFDARHHELGLMKAVMKSLTPAPM